MRLSTCIRWSYDAVSTAEVKFELLVRHSRKDMKVGKKEAPWEGGGEKPP
jgi:hypothetical protein